MSVKESKAKAYNLMELFVFMESHSFLDTEYKQPSVEQAFRDELRELFPSEENRELYRDALAYLATII